MAGIEPISEQNLEDVLPLIRRYQEFYRVADIDENRNRSFFSQFGKQSEKGCLFGYRAEGKLVAFATVYFSFSSTIAAKVAIMNDLYTEPTHRQQGIGRLLIEHCEAFGRKKGAVRLQWVTARDNEKAQSLYRSLGARQSSWEHFLYTATVAIALGAAFARRYFQSAKGIRRLNKTAGATMMGTGGCLALHN